MDYYISLAEIAISYFNTLSEIYNENTLTFTLSHHIVTSPVDKYMFYNPSNMCFDLSVRDIAEYIKELSQQGALVMASNADPKNTDLDDNFFDDLYAGLNINRILASRMINSNAQKRGKISELLICNY